MSTIDTFADPPREYGPVPFWFLNEKLDTDRLQWQVREMHDKHVFGAVMHARPGLVTPYLSEEWFKAISDILEQARDCGMYMWIYDEYPWASGMAEYRVPKLHPDFRIRALDRLEMIVEGPEDVCWDFSDQLPNDCAGIVAAIKTPVYQGNLLAAGEDVSESLDQNKLELKLEDGAFQLAVFFERLSYNPYGDGFGRHPVSDLMHARAMQEFIRLTHAEYEKRFPEHIGTTITATFTDEPPSDTPGWSRVFLDEFSRRKGYDLRPWLPFLWHDGGPATGKVRIDYDDVKGQLYEECFFGALEEWSDTVGIASTGHLLLEETLPLHQRFMGDYFRSMRRLHYPGIDYIFPGVIPAVVPKMAASVANLYNRERVISECFALTGWDFTFEHMKWMTDWQLVHGVNLLVPHAFFYSSTEEEPIPQIPDDLGFRWYDCPPSMFFQQPYWDYYTQYADYLRRSCWLLSQGEHDNDGIALYYPIETVQAEVVPTKEHTNSHAFEIPGTWMTADYLWEGSSPEQTDAHFRASANMLRDGGLDFDVVDDDSLREAEIGEGSITVQNCREYRAIILPRTRWISADVYRNIHSFWRSGGLVIATGSLPQRAVEGPEHDREIISLTEKIFGLPPQQLDKLIEMGEDCPIPETLSAVWFSRPDHSLVDRLRSAGLGSFSSSCPYLYAMHRRIGSAHLYYLVHFHASESRDVTINLEGHGVVMWMDPYTGETLHTEADGTDEGVTLNRCFDPYEACFVLIDPHAHDKGFALQERSQDLKLKKALTVEGDWKVTLDGGDRSELRVKDLPQYPELDSIQKDHRWDKLGPWEEKGFLEFSGGATYETTFTWDDDIPEEVLLDLGQVGIVAEVHLNDQSLGVRLWRPYRFELGEALKRGENRLKVRVVNTLANSIQATYGTGRIKSQAAPHHVEKYSRFREGYLRSGLIGPVKILKADL